MGRGVYLAKEDAAAILVDKPFFDEETESEFWWDELEKNVVIALPVSYWLYVGRRTTDRGNQIFAENYLVSVSLIDADAHAVIEASVRVEAYEGALHGLAMRHVELVRDIIGRRLAEQGYKLLIRTSSWTVAVDDRFMKG